MQTKVADDDDLLIESEQRFAYPLGLEVVSIPTERWPNSVSEHETTMERVVYRCFGRDPAEYEGAFVTQWVAALLDGIQRNEETYNIVDSYTSVSTLDATRLFYESNTEIDAETRSACISVILSLGLVRVRCNLHDRTKKFAEFTQNLRVLILDMKQCEQLLRIGIRSLTADSQTTLDTTFDEEIAWREATAFSVENNLKRFIAFTSALLARKWGAIRKIRKLKKRREEFEVATADKQNVESTIANEIYKRVNEHLSSEKTTVARLSKQIATMRRLLTNTRKVLTQVYTHLYAEWNDINSSLRKVREMLRSYHVSMPDVVNDVILRDDYTTELMKSYEILRNCNTLVLKLTDDTYDLTYESLLPRVDRSVLQNWVHTASGAPSDHGLEDLFDKNEAGENNTKKAKPTQPISPLEENCVQALNELSLAIQATRRHYTSREWNKSPLDIRRLALSFFRVLDTRVRSFSYYNRDALIGEPSEKLAENDNNNSEPDQLVLTRIRELEKNVPTTSSAAKIRLRSLGDNIVALRDTQDAFDLSYFIQSLEFRLNKMLQYRFPTDNTSADKTIGLMYDEHILEELEKATRENFSQLSDEWDSLILNLKTAEHNSTKTTGLAAERNLAGRIEEWHYRNIDPFKITIMNARLTQIDNVQEVSAIRKTVAKYAYLLSWMLELRVFLREPREPTAGGVQAQTTKKKKSRKRASDDKERAVSPKRLRKISNDTSDDEDGAGYLQQIRKRKRTEDAEYQNKRRKEDEENVSSVTSDELYEHMDYSTTECSEGEYSEDSSPLVRKRKISTDTGGPSAVKKPNIEMDEMNDDGAELKRLQRIIELSPSLLNVRLLNDIMEKEHRKQNELFESMDKNMRNIENMLRHSLTMEKMQMMDVTNSPTTPDETPAQLYGISGI